MLAEQGRSSSSPFSGAQSGAFPLSRPFPAPVAVLAQVSWTAARTGLPGSPLPLVSFLGPRPGGAAGQMKHRGINLAGVWVGSQAAETRGSCVTYFAAPNLVWVSERLQAGDPWAVWQRKNQVDPRV